MFKKMLVIAAAAAVISACGGKSGGGNAVSKDAKADYQMTAAQLDSLDENNDAVVKAYEGKIIEMKGIVRKAKKSESSANPNNYFFNLYDGSQQDFLVPYAICYTDTDILAQEGKTVTVKGKLNYAGAFALENFLLY
jgi:hypothetical protein